MKDITRDLIGKKITDIYFTGDYYQILLDTGDMYEVRGSYDYETGTDVNITKYSKEQTEYYLKNFYWEHKRNKG